MLSAQKIKVYHVEDYTIMRDGVKSLLSRDERIEMVGEASNAEDLFFALETSSVDVVILDLFLDAMENLKNVNGFEICEALTLRYPKIRVIAHSAYDDADRVARILKTGARGFVSKKSGFDELIQAVKAVKSGRIFVCSRTSKKLKNLNEFLCGLADTLKATDEIFSARERQVLSLLSRGLSSQEIGTSLFITERTVESHRKHMLLKGQVRNTAELIAFASDLGLVKK